MGRKEKPVDLENVDNLPIGQLMRLSRQNKHITLSAMANQLLYSRGYLSMVENGHKQPTVDLLRGYEQVLELESGYLSQTLQSSEQVVSFLEQTANYLDQLNHLDVLLRDVDSWNLWREEHSEIHPFLARVNLHEADLSGVNLSGVDLTRVDLSGASLIKADLSTAVLRQAFMSGAALNGANLSRAYLNGAKLFSAKLSRANLSEANLSGADLSNTDLSEADLNEANLSGADLSMADLTGSNLTRANLTGANLNMADFNASIISNTIFGNVDLSQVRGLESVQHTGPSVIGLDTIERSQAKIPEAFLQKAGTSNTFITYMRSLVNRPIEYYSCFISYSNEDREFTERLYTDLQAKGVRCWFAPADMRAGDKIRSSIDEAIKLSDKLITVLSNSSIESSWVALEIEAALEKERRQKREILFPVRLDDSIKLSSHSWANHLRRTRHIGDFTEWKDNDDYQRSLRRLLRDLQPPIAKSSESQAVAMALLAEQAVYRWFEESHYRPEQHENRGMPDFIITDKDGKRVGVEVKFYTEPRTVRHKLGELSKILERTQTEVDRFHIVATFPDESTASKAASFIRSADNNIMSDLSLTLGYIQHNEFQEI